jgi:myo-inositol-1(or 4)-monophosphatase
MLEKIKNIVKEAGQIMLSAHHIRDGIESKQGRANFVTKYDVEVQNFLYRELGKVLPDAGFIGEEDKSWTESDAKYCFIIDPIDGTTNFIFDYRHSAISIGLLYQGEIILGVVYNPYLDELFYAEKGKGAYLNGRRLIVSGLSINEGIAAIGTCPYNREKAEETFRLARKLYDIALDIRRSGSAALDICYVAANRYAIYFELILSPWDYAGASLILKEAGGCISTMDRGELPYTLSCPVLAASAKAYEEFYDIR